MRRSADTAAAYNDGYTAGRAAGREEGKLEGYAAGYEHGYEDGYNAFIRSQQYHTIMNQSNSVKPETKDIR